jgi:hypothetical protein
VNIEQRIKAVQDAMPPMWWVGAPEPMPEVCDVCECDYGSLYPIGEDQLCPFCREETLQLAS